MKQNICILFLLFVLCDVYGIDPSTLPGRDKNSSIYVAKFGNLRVFFYNHPDTSSLAKELIEDVSFRMIHGVANHSCNDALVAPLSVLYQNPIAYNGRGEPIFADSLGNQLLDNKANKIKNMANQILNIDILETTHEMSLVLNFDSLKFQQDNFAAQHKFLNEDSQNSQKYFLVKNSTVIDWEMAKGTFASIIMQDPESEDRFIFPQFPKEMLQYLFVEPIPSISRNTYASTLQCTSPPLDWLSCIGPGSAKGKKITFSLNGLVAFDQIADLDSRSCQLVVNRGQQKENRIEYPSGLIIAQLAEQLNINREHVDVLPDFFGVEVFQTNPKDNLQAISVLNEIFQLDCPLDKVMVKHLVKRGNGFTDLDTKLLNIPKDCHVVILNNSEIPNYYRSYNIAQDFSKEGLPWVQLYDLPPSKAMLVSSEDINDLSLTPVEEIFYRNADLDKKEQQLDIFKGKISSKIDLFIFPNRS